MNDQSTLSPLRLELARNTLCGEEIVMGWTAPARLLAGAIPGVGVTAVVAKKEHGKTMLLTDVGLAVAHGVDSVAGAIENEYLVVYVAAEDPDGVRVAAAAWRQHHGIEEISDDFVIIKQAPNLGDDACMLEWAEHMKVVAGGRRVLTIVDTWQTSTVGAAQSDDRDMGAAIERAKRLGECVGGPVVIAFHPPRGWANRIMGSTVIENACAAVLSIHARAGGVFAVQVDYLKGGGKREPFGFAIERDVETGISDSKGNAVAGAVAVPREAAPARAASSRGADLDDLKERAAEAVAAWLAENEPSPERPGPSLTWVHRRMAEAEPPAAVRARSDANGRRTWSPRTVEKRMGELFPDDDGIIHFGAGSAFAAGGSHGGDTGLTLEIERAGDGNGACYVLVDSDGDPYQEAAHRP